jgi:hypothetical protein
MLDAAAESNAERWKEDGEDAAGARSAAAQQHACILPLSSVPERFLQSGDACAW